MSESIESDPFDDDDEFRCEHEHVVLTKKATAAGTRYWKQCQTCGAKTESVRTDQISPARRAQCPDYDQGLHDKWWQLRRTRWEEIRNHKEQERQQQNKEWWEWYNAYLLTPRWREIRRRIMDRANGNCEGCAQQPATQVHHRTYDHVGDELLFELVAICDTCHKRVHDGNEHQ